MVTVMVKMTSRRGGSRRRRVDINRKRVGKKVNKHQNYCKARRRWKEVTLNNLPLIYKDLINHLFLLLSIEAAASAPPARLQLSIFLSFLNTRDHLLSQINHRNLTTTNFTLQNRKQIRKIRNGG